MYAYDPVRTMARAYEALAAGDIDGFVRPLAPAIVTPVLTQILGSVPADATALRLTAATFQFANGRLRVNGYCQAIRRTDGTHLRAPFCHEWQLMYGVAWRFDTHPERTTLDV